MYFMELMHYLSVVLAKLNGDLNGEVKFHHTWELVRRYMMWKYKLHPFLLQPEGFHIGNANTLDIFRIVDHINKVEGNQVVYAHYNPTDCNTIIDTNIFNFLDKKFIEEMEMRLV